MSLAAMHWARQSLKTAPDSIKAPARLALMLLADYADEQHASWPSISTMALEMGCSVRSVQRSIDLLASHGLLMVEKRHATNGRQMSNRYHLAVAGLFELGRQSDTPSMSDPLGEGDNLTPSEGDSLTGEGVTGDRGRVSPVTPLEPTSRTLPLTPSLSGAGDSPDPPTVLERAAQQTDDGTPPPSQPRLHPMTLDWQPDPEQLAMACQRAGLPVELAPAAHQLAKFTAHHADHPERQHSATAWTAKLVDWLRNDRRAASPATGGTPHAQRHPTAGGYDRQRERDRIAKQLANPHDVSWADGLWPDDDAPEPGAQAGNHGAGQPGVRPAGSDLPEDVLECLPECGPAQAQSPRAGAGAGPLAVAADAAGARARDERPQARGQYLAADDPGAGRAAGANAGGLRHDQHR